MASKRRSYTKECDGKFRYETAAEAWVAANRTGKGVRQYKCTFCGKFHVGHPVGKQKRRRKFHV